MSHNLPTGTQYFTDENGIQYWRPNASSPWIPVSGQPQNPGGQPFRMPDAALPQERQHVVFPEQQGAVPLPNTQGPIPPLSGPSHPCALPSGFRGLAPPHAPAQPAIDPTLLPDDDEADFPPPHKLALERGIRPAAKVAGSRRSLADPKGKGKQRAVDQPVTSGSSLKRKASTPLDLDAPKAKRGHTPGVANYSADDVDALLDILEERLPLGGHAWNSATDEFNAWATENMRPARSAKSLELKFKQLVKTSKPTGDAECPPHVLRAHEIDDLMNEKAGSRDLDDEDIVDAPDVVELSDNEETQPNKRPASNVDKKLTVKSEKADADTSRVPVARHPPTDRLPSREPRAARNQSQDILTSISSALDPRARQSRADEHSIAAMQSTQLFQLSSQLRETQRQLEGVRTQLAEAERRCNAAERRADRAELRLELSGSAANADRHRPITPHRHSTFATPPQRRRRYRQEVYYRDGGRSTRWVGGSDDDDMGVNNFQDSPGTRRYTILDDDDDSHSGAHGLPRPGSPFRSAATPLNNTLQPARSVSSQLGQSGGLDGVKVRVTPHDDHSSSVSVLVSPTCRRQDPANTTEDLGRRSEEI